MDTNPHGSDRTPPNQHNESARQHSAEVIRGQVNHQYAHNPPNQLQASNEDNPYHRTHQPTYDWQQYHTAWQQYYQQYYQRYYEQQLAQQRSFDQTSQVSTITGSDTPELSRFQQIKADLLKTIRDRATKTRKSNRFVPILSAIIVGLIFVFLQYNRVIAAQIQAHITTINASPDTVDPAANATVSDDPRIIIPKINVNAPVVYGVTSVEDRAVQAALEKGVVHYNLPGANSVPGQAGNTVILGHSSNDVFDPGSYKFAFVLVNRLDTGDTFYLNYKGKRYIYQVREKKVIDPQQWQALQTANSKPTATLVTCTPLGTALDRLLIIADQISPDPSSASAKPSGGTTANPAKLPGNSPTFFERLWNALF